MPTVALSDSLTVLAPDDIICLVNLQHDCHRGECDTSGSQFICQQREVTLRSRALVHHRDQTHFIINTQSLHNYCHISWAIPSHLHGSSFRIADPAGLRKQAASILRDKKQQQVEARKAISMASVMGRAEALPSLALANVRHNADDETARLQLPRTEEAPLPECLMQPAINGGEHRLQLPRAGEASLPERFMQAAVNSDEPRLQLPRAGEALLPKHLIQPAVDGGDPQLQLPRAEKGPIPELLIQTAVNGDEPELRLPRAGEAPPQSHFPSGAPIFSQPSTSASAQGQGTALTTVPTTLEGCRKDVLQHYCRISTLPISGNKPQLLARLNKYYNSPDRLPPTSADIAAAYETCNTNKPSTVGKRRRKDPGMNEDSTAGQASARKRRGAVAEDTRLVNEEML